MIAEVLLIVAGLYLLGGLAFALPFVLLGVNKIDPHAAHGSWGFRLLIIPGTMFLWPLLARRWMKGIHEPPEENNPHRHAARESRPSPLLVPCDRREQAHSKSATAQDASGGRVSQSVVPGTGPSASKGAPA